MRGAAVGEVDVIGRVNGDACREVADRVLVLGTRGASVNDATKLGTTVHCSASSATHPAFRECPVTLRLVLVGKLQAQRRLLLCSQRVAVQASELGTLRRWCCVLVTLPPAAQAGPGRVRYVLLVAYVCQSPLRAAVVLHQGRFLIDAGRHDVAEALQELGQVSCVGNLRSRAPARLPSSTPRLAAPLTPGEVVAVAATPTLPVLVTPATTSPTTLIVVAAPSSAAAAPTTPAASPPLAHGEQCTPARLARGRNDSPMAPPPRLLHPSAEAGERR